MAKLKENAKYKTSPNFLLREIGGESILVPIGEVGDLTNSVISLNDTSQFLWKEFQEPSTIEEVIVNAKKKYSAPEGVMEQEIQAFVNAYLQVGLLMIEEE